MLIRDRLDVLFEDEEFAGLYPHDGRPGLSPGQLALVSVLQFAENLSDRAAADAVRTRIAPGTRHPRDAELRVASGFPAGCDADSTTATSRPRRSSRARELHCTRCLLNRRCRPAGIRKCREGNEVGKAGIRAAP
ncbi:transposase [Streptomyces sp. NPDC048415]|uniref:transposase n=1 Tax=Streptomyces sp. NPDC048415 TaxID=3154822 RepID=UPI0034207118